MIIYLLKSMLCSGCLYLFYHFVLEQEKMYRMNRFYLLFSLVFSFAIPLLELRETKIANSQSQQLESISVSFTQAPAQLVHSAPAALVQVSRNWPQMMYIAYLLVAILLLIRFSRNLIQLFASTKGHDKIQHQDATLILTDQNSGAYSFLSYIFLNRKSYLSGTLPLQILDHELTHVREKHTLDILLIELLLSIAWFNPILLLYRRAMLLNHEFLADEHVLITHSDIAQYQNLLVSAVLIPNQPTLTSKFNYSLTKKRLIMMKKQANQKAMLLKQLCMMPLFSAAVFIFCGNVEVAHAQTQQEPAVVRIVKPKESRITKIDHPVFFAAGRKSESTEKGVSESMMAEYKELGSNYQFDEKNHKGFLKKGTPGQQSRMEEIWRQMSISQQQMQKLSFARKMNPIPFAGITSNQLKTWKNPTYGVWINGKRVKNASLADYSENDFGHATISKLYGVAKKENRTYQIDLMTKAYLKDFNENLKNRPEYNMYYTINKYTK